MARVSLILATHPDVTGSAKPLPMLRDALESAGHAVEVVVVAGEGDATRPLAAALSGLERAGGDVLLTGRSEGFIRGLPDLAETIRRLKAYADAGADCLYAPGISTREQIAAVVKAVAPKPVNFLMGGPGELTVADFTDLGVRRISVGGALARAAWGGIMRTIKLIAEAGSFKGFADDAPGADIMKGLAK